MAERQLTQEYVRSLFEYDPETGVLTWKERPIEHFPSKRAWRIWNKKNSAQQAGSDSGLNYWRVGIDGKKYLLHRVAWLLAMGSWPEFIDHKNRIRSDNRLINLRSVTRQINCQNISLGRRNTSGCLGVSWNKRLSKWQVSLSRKHIGFFVSKEEAIAARKKAENAHGYGC